MKSNAQNRPSVLVIGGGIIGLTCAWRLATAGAAVTLIEDATPTLSASWGNAGQIAVEQVTPLASPGTLLSAPRQFFRLSGGPVDLVWKEPRSWFPWLKTYLTYCTPVAARKGQRALEGVLADAVDAWRALTLELGVPHLLDVDGHYMVWMKGHAERQARHALKRPSGTVMPRMMTDAERAKIRDTYGVSAESGVCFVGSARIGPPGSILQVLREAVKSRCDVVQGRVRQLKDRGAVLEDGRHIEADRILVAAGARSGEILPEYGNYLVAERGYHIEWEPGEVPYAPPLVFEDHSIIVSMMEGRMRASTFVEFGRWDAPADVVKWEHLEKSVRAFGLPIQSEFSRWMGSRPTLPDYLPAMGAIPGRQNVFGAFGHHHLGLTMAAVTASSMASLLMTGKADRDLRPFDPGRFRISRAFTKENV